MAKQQPNVRVRVLAGFVDARAHFRSYVPGDEVEIAKDKAEALSASGHVEILGQEHPAARRQTKVARGKSTKAAKPAPEPTPEPTPEPAGDE